MLPPRSMEAGVREENDEALARLREQVRGLRGATADLNATAGRQGVLSDLGSSFDSLASDLTSSSNRLVRMAKAGDKVAIFKLAAVIVAVVVVLWWVWGFLAKW